MRENKRKIKEKHTNYPGDHDATATGVGYVGTEVVYVVVMSGVRMVAPITSSDVTGNTFRNFSTGGMVKGMSACEPDVSGGATGSVVDVIHS